MTRKLLQPTTAFVGLMCFSSSAFSQPEPPPGPAEPLPPEELAPETPTLETAAPDVSETAAPETAEPPPPPAPPPPAADVAVAADPALADSGPAAAAPAESAVSAGVEPTAAPPKSNAEEIEQRRLSRQNGITRWGGSGLTRVGSPGSSAPGTFSIGLLAGYFSQTGFLCPQCTRPGGGTINGVPVELAQDNASRSQGDLLITATPWPFLEAFFTVHNSAAANDLETPPVLQVLGDVGFGVKAFVPRDEWELFNVGGALDLQLLNAAGDVGVGNVNANFRGLASIDFTDQKAAENRIPFIGYLNLSYFLDNSSGLVTAIEEERGRGPGTAGGVISRMERFGLDINRVDFFQIAFGAEVPLDIIHPFLEWSIDVPVNRQGYACQRNETYSGDRCMADVGFDVGVVPSRLTLGARAYPWLDGLGVLLGFDIGTGATTAFVEELAPEVPWQFMFGVSYTADVDPPVVIQEVPAPAFAAVAPERRIAGQVFAQGTETPLPDALIRYEGRPHTGMIADAEGKFLTGNLEPGTYTFTVQAEGYRPGSCEVTLVDDQGVAAGAPGDAAASPSTDTVTAGTAAPQAGTTSLRCELRELPKIGNVEGAVVDAVSATPIQGVELTITDELNRSLSLSADQVGAFRFENVPPGVVRISAKKDGYLLNAVDVTIVAKEEATIRILLNRAPVQKTVRVVGKQLKITTPVLFYPGNADLLPASSAVVQEMASLLQETPEITQLEIQGHVATDDLALSAARANTVRDLLIRLGVAGGRLSAVGLGNTKSKGDKSERVEFLIKE